MVEEFLQPSDGSLPEQFQSLADCVHDEFSRRTVCLSPSSRRRSTANERDEYQCACRWHRWSGESRWDSLSLETWAPSTNTGQSSLSDPCLSHRCLPEYLHRHGRSDERQCAVNQRKRCEKQFYSSTEIDRRSSSSETQTTAFGIECEHSLDQYVSLSLELFQSRQVRPREQTMRLQSILHGELVQVHRSTRTQLW